MLNGAIWVPLVFLFLFRLTRGERSLTSAMWAGVFQGFAWLSGHHEIPIYTSLAALPVYLRPLEHGADFALHSATKYLGGHSDVLLGAVVCGSADDAKRLRDFRGRTGIVAAPDPCWLLLRSLRTLKVRMERITATAQELAERLRAHPAVSEVRYPGFGGLMSFDVADPRKVETSVSLIANATSLGGTESLLESRRRWEGERVPEGLLRLSVGLEDVDELWTDLEQALS
jgi:cystathionine gamma-synthase